MTYESKSFDGPEPHDPLDELDIGDAVVFIFFGRKSIGVIVEKHERYMMIDGGAGVLQVENSKIIGHPYQDSICSLN